MRSSIKIKFGICPDCPEGSKEKPLTAKRCYFHNEIFKEERKEGKRKMRENMNAFLGISEKPKKQPKPIPKVSEKRKAESREYKIKRLQFLAQPGNQKCPVTGEQATEIHHKAGRTGSHYLDENNWLAVSRNGHRKIEENPEWAKENGYSLNRL